MNRYVLANICCMMTPEDQALALMSLTDRAAIRELVDRYAKVFDDRSFTAMLPTLFVPDSEIQLPPGGHHGLEGMDDFHKDVMRPFGPTQHLFTNTLVDTDDDRATFQANTHVTHTVLKDDSTADDNNLFLAGGVLAGVAVRTSFGWRFQSVTLEAIWRQGDFGPPAQ